MPRRNRRIPERCAPLRELKAHQLDELAWFAHQHLDVHLAALDDPKRDPGLVMTGSEHPQLGYRFLSTGRSFDAAAIKLTGRNPSGAAGTVRA